MAIVLRYSDINNYYCVVGSGVDGEANEPSGLTLYRRKDGNTEIINSVKVNRFSDGTYVDDGTPSWIPFRITWFVDEMDAFRIRIQEDADNNGGWEKTGGALVDPDPVLGPDDTKTGSGIGFGTVANVDDRNDKGIWIDQTKIYYGQN